MAKTKSHFVCQNCGYVSPRMLGHCPNCGAWNQFVEELERPKAKVPQAQLSHSVPQPTALTKVAFDETRRIVTGLSELDRVLGGGLVPGSLILIGGDPGIGKSTLLLQVSGRLEQTGGRVLYVSGEESPSQIKW